MELFRKEALESFSSNAGISSGVRAVSIKAATFSALLALCAASFLFWFFFGTIYETVTVDGIIWPVSNDGAVYSVYDGTVTKTSASVGDYVKTGDILAVLPQEDILDQIEAAIDSGASEDELQALYDEYDRHSIIRSSTDGVVTYIVEDNSYIAQGDMVAEVTPYDETGNNRILTAFIPSENSGIVTLGMDAQVMPDFAPRDEYGYINAYVSGVSSYPVTGSSIEQSNNALIAGEVDQNQRYIQIEITMIPDSTAQSGLKWSDPSSGGIDVAMGTVCTVDIVTKECRPYEWLF